MLRVTLTVFLAFFAYVAKAQVAIYIDPTTTSAGDSFKLAQAVEHKFKLNSEYKILKINDHSAINIRIVTIRFDPPQTARPMIAYSATWTIPSSEGKSLEVQTFLNGAVGSCTAEDLISCAETIFKATNHMVDDVRNRSSKEL